MKKVYICSPYRPTGQEREKDLQTLIDAVCEQEPGIPKYEQSIQDAVKALHTD